MPPVTTLQNFEFEGSCTNGQVATAGRIKWAAQFDYSRMNTAPLDLRIVVDPIATAN